MDPLRILLQLCHCDDSEQIFHAFVGAFSDVVEVRGAARVRCSDAVVLESHPRDASWSPEFVEAAARALRPEIFPVGSQYAMEAADFPHSELLLVPLRGVDPETLAVVFEVGAIGEDVAAWEELAEALEDMRNRGARLAAADREREELRRRAEESEALHTLGLAANRTLDQEEVLSLVARFTRTLLGAHYATVHTREGDAVHLVASVGLRGVEGEGRGESHTAAGGDSALARRVIEVERPLTVGGPGNEPVDGFSFDAAQGMKVGLGIPLALYGDTFGALVVGYRRQYEVTSADVRLALTLAGHAAVAISNAHLHRRLAERASELDQAYRDLNQATQAKERFFNAISHDLRTPVGAIKGYMELILAGAVGEIPPKVESYVRNTYRASHTLLALVNDILDFAKLESGRLKPEIEEWELAALLDDALAAVQPQAEAKGLSLELTEGGPLPRVETDGKRARQILVNLLSNAVKFTEEGAVRVAVEVIHNDGIVSIRVSDTGRGIPAEDLERVFEEFEQVAGSEGTGLGLPISRRLARLLGGDLTVSSTVGQGSTITFHMPLRLQEGSGEEEDPDPEPDGGGGAASTGAGRSSRSLTRQTANSRQEE